MKILVFFAAAATSAFAGPRRHPLTPVTPTPGPDLKLTGGKSLEDFFAARRADTDCRERLGDATEAYVDKKREFDKAVREFRARWPKEDTSSEFKADAKNIEKLEVATAAMREPVLIHAEECGDCATNLIDSPPPFQDLGRRQVWYVSDGSCYLPDSDDADYEFRAKSLLNVPMYPQRTGGFRDILFFQSYDKVKQIWNPTEIVPIPDSHIYVAVKLPLAKTGILKYALDYYFKNFSKGFDPKAPQFTVEFESDTKPLNLSEKKLAEYRANYNKVPYKAHHLVEVKGFWWVTKNSVRYYTAADFGSLTGAPILDDLATRLADALSDDAPFIEKDARRVHLDTMLQMAGRSTAGDPFRVAREKMRRVRGQ